MERGEMKQLKKTGKTKSKKTIRHMTQLARKAAHLTRAMESVTKRLGYLTEALYELEMSERAAQAQITGHALVCPLVSEPVEPPTAELWPEVPNGEGIIGLTESEVIQGREAPPGCDAAPGDGEPS